MKKKDKVTLIIVASMFVIGLAMITSGYMAESTQSGIYELRNLDIMDHMVIHLGYDSGDDGPTATLEGISMKLDEIENLDINIDAGDVHIKQVEGDDIKIDLSGSDRCKYYVKDETLYLTDEGADNSNTSNMVVLGIPKDMKYDDVSLAIGAASVYIETLACEDIDIKLGAGDIRIESLSVDDMAKIKIAAGEFIVEDADIVDGDIDLGMGDIDFEGKAIGDLKVKCGIGNASLHFDDSKDEHSFSTKCGLGAITIDGTTMAAIGEKTKKSSGSDSHYDIDCGLGNVDITFTK